MAICAWCKKLRDDEGYWQNIEANIKKYSVHNLTHGICNDCAKKEYPELYQELNKSEADI
jgi:hypothetical protein